MSEPWIGVTRFELLNGNPPEAFVRVQRQTHEETGNNKTTSGQKNGQMCQKVHSAKPTNKCAEDLDDDPDDEEMVNTTRRKLGIKRASAMPCTVTTPASPKGSSWGRPRASVWSKMDTKRLNSSCSKKDHEDIIIESQRTRPTKSTENTHKDHIADRGHVSISLFNMVHEPIPTPKAMKIPEAKAALDKVC